jgi:endoglucanase
MSIDRENVIRLLAEFDAINGVSGYEQPVADCLIRKMEHLTDTQYTDTLGNCICVRKGSEAGKKILISAHMDEIGFLVCDITDDGYITLLPVGMHNPSMLVNQTISIYTRHNGTIYGVLAGGKPIHFTKEQNAPLSIGDLRLDVGCTTSEEVRALGVRVGDPMNIEKPGRILNQHTFCGKAVDNRSGVVSMLLAMELLKDEQTEATVYCCGTVQEEIGIKGARVLAQQLRPDIALAVDVGFSAENREMNASSTRIYMGKGPSIQMYDWNPATFLGNMVPRSVSDALAAAAQKAGIPYQEHVNLNGGTDAAEISLSNGGVPTGNIAIPERYIHTSVGTVDIRDVIHAAQMIAQFIRDAN